MPGVDRPPAEGERMDETRLRRGLLVLTWTLVAGLLWSGCPSLNAQVCQNPREGFDRYMLWSPNLAAPSPDGVIRGAGPHPRPQKTVKAGNPALMQNPVMRCGGTCLPARQQHDIPV